MTDEQIDDVIDTLLVDIDDPEVKAFSGALGKIYATEIQSKYFDHRRTIRNPGNLLEVGDVKKEVEEEIQERLKPKIQ